jgi:hypothetical protein
MNSMEFQSGDLTGFSVKVLQFIARHGEADWIFSDGMPVSGPISERFLFRDGQEAPTLLRSVAPCKALVREVLTLGGWAVPLGAKTEASLPRGWVYREPLGVFPGLEIKDYEFLSSWTEADETGEIRKLLKSIGAKGWPLLSGGLGALCLDGLLDWSEPWDNEQERSRLVFRVTDLGLRWAFNSVPVDRYDDFPFTGWPSTSVFGVTGGPSGFSDKLLLSLKN